ncbi:MAG: ArsA-related P-loop ATPase [Pseudomonadales bacterium]
MPIGTLKEKTVKEQTLKDSHRLVIVSGKGGVGKSVLAAAVARRSVEAGRRTVLVTLDTRDDTHPLLDVPLRYDPQPTAHGFFVSRVDAFQAVAEYARRMLPFGAMYEAFFNGRAFHDFAAAAPGFEELMCLGKLYNLAVETDFDRVVFDAPSTGHLRDLLTVPGVTQRAVRVGPLNHNARKIEDLLLDPDRTQVLVATLAEEMPVREALEIVALCRDELRMGVGTILVNRRVPKRFTAGELTSAEALRHHGRLSAAAIDVLQTAQVQREEARSQFESLEPLRRARLATVEVPRIVQPSYDGDALVTAVAVRLNALFSGGAPVPRPAPAAAMPSGGAEAAVPAVAAPALSLREIVCSRRILVCCGSGGVGKTTGAAALGVLAAREGRRVQVMTIDPARRLAQSMGLDALDHDARRVPLEAPGELWARMLDSKHAFDDLVRAYAPSERVREAIFANHYYQQLSTSLGGSRELMAMEQVLETVQAGDYDLLIVDTPPSQHALDFLDAPERIVSLLDGSMTSLLVRPYGLAARAQFDLFRQSSAMALKFMERFTGVQMLADLSDFLLAFSGMFDGFKERSHRVQALMREPTTSFLLVCAPEPASLRQVDQFASRLRRDGLDIAGVLANRVHAAPPGMTTAHAEPELGDADLAALAELGDRAFSDDPLPERLLAVWRDARDLHTADARALQGLEHGGLALHTVPRLSRDLHSMADLGAFTDCLQVPSAGDADRPPP